MEDNNTRTCRKPKRTFKQKAFENCFFPPSASQKRKAPKKKQESNLLG